ncbi:MAG: DUF1801 domain-containing protein [Hyphomonadaceae bacterium]
MAKAPSVDDFLDKLSHARIDDIRALRRIILDTDKAITERVKWNAPSFCWQDDDRVTMRLHPGDRLELIFHRGVKARDAKGFSFDDPTGRIKWADADRGVLSIDDPAQEKDDISELVAAWMSATA